VDANPKNLLALSRVLLDLQQVGSRMPVGPQSGEAFEELLGAVRYKPRFVVLGTRIVDLREDPIAPLQAAGPGGLAQVLAQRVNLEANDRVISVPAPQDIAHSLEMDGGDVQSILICVTVPHEDAHRNLMGRADDEQRHDSQAREA
jgi:hypothetical protein